MFELQKVVVFLHFFDKTVDVADSWWDIHSSPGKSTTARFLYTLVYGFT